MHALGKMCSGIVHDFNNLLSPILGFTELLLSIPALLQDPEKVALYLQKIRTAANDGAAVVERLREFYRSRADAEPAAEFSLQSLIPEVVDLTSHRWQNEAQAAGVAIHVETDLAPTAPVFGSAPELRQALTNLILNGVDAMPEGGTMRLRTYAVGNWVCLQVSDTGTGMSDEVRRRCFEPFFTTKGRAGTGLGLAITFGIIERHHGRMEIESAEGRGTTFTLWLPASRAEHPTDDGAAPVTPAGGRPLRILVVDDEDLLLEVMSQQLVMMGHVVECFTEPKKGLERLYQQSFDMIFTDRAMPGMSGDQFARLVREYNTGIPVVLLTGFGSIIKETGENVENVDEVVAKPISHQTLRELVARHGSRCTLGPKA
jgi:CheY-like chemotaxis protein